MAKIKPIGIQILVEPDPAEAKTEGGIIVPDTVQAKEKPNRGTVVAIGELVNKLIISPGSRIIFGKYAGVEIENEEKKLLIMKDREVFAVLES